MASRIGGQRRQKINALFSLTDKVAIVTGSGRGIGKAIALGLAGAGAKVTVAARTVAEIEATADEIRAGGGEALAVPADVLDICQVANIVQQTMVHFSRVDILVNNAGGNPAGVGRALDLDEETLEKLIALNLKSVLLCSQAAARVMMQQNNGSIINISSIAGLRASPGRLAYNAAKAGVINLTYNLAAEWAPHNIRVNSIAPGLIRTSETTRFYEQQHEMKKTRLRNIPLGHFGEPQDLVGVAIYLGSDASGYVTGVTIPVDGGLTLRDIADFYAWVPPDTAT